MKRSISISVIVAMLLTALIAVYAPVYANPAAAKNGIATAKPTNNGKPTKPPKPPQETTPTIDAASAILIDATTGDVIWEKNPDERRPIASTTKIMTAILAIESDRLEDSVTVTSNVVAAGRWGIKLILNEQVKQQGLLYALMLNSANDSAVAIAEKIGGTLDNFISMMNLKAINLGATNTHYTNPHGLPDGNPYSTARDLAKITRYAIKNKTFVDLVSTKKTSVYRSGATKPTVVENRNKLLWTYKGAIGVKTGHTNSAGFCLVSAAKRDRVSLIAVVLGGKAPDTIFTNSAALLDYGFSLYEEKTVIEKGKPYKTLTTKYGEKVHLVPTADISTLVRRSDKINVKVTSKRLPDPPIKRGMQLGSVKILQSGRTIATAPLVAKENIKEPSPGQIMGYYWNNFWSAVF